MPSVDVPPPYRLRPLRLGDIGWVIHRQAILYNQDHGWNVDFEILLAEIFVQVMKTFDPSRERGWIAERGGETIGSAFVVSQNPEIARLRLLYVEPSARGLGIGRQLIQECLGFARKKSYAKLVLWTNDVLVAARRLYRQAGFKCVAAEPQHAFGHDMISETWELVL